jgi:hypothetical protein
MVITVSFAPVSGTLHAGNSKRYAILADLVNAVFEGLLRIRSGDVVLSTVHPLGPGQDTCCNCDVTPM